MVMLNNTIICALSVLINRQYTRNIVKIVNSVLLSKVLSFFVVSISNIVSQVYLSQLRFSIELEHSLKSSLLEHYH